MWKVAFLEGNPPLPLTAPGLKVACGGCTSGIDPKIWPPANGRFYANRIAVLAAATAAFLHNST
jgi:hypothetical protein